MAFPVQGKNIVLEVLNENDSNYYRFACAQRFSYSVETEQLPATSANSGSFRRNKPALSQGKFSLSGITFLRDQSATKWVVFDMMMEQFRKNGLTYKITLTDDEGYVRTVSGNATIPSTSFEGEVGQLSKFSIEFLCDGPIVIDGVISNPTSSDVKDYLYEATGGESSFTHADAAGRTILAVIRAGYPYKVTLAGTPTGFECLYDTSSGGFSFESAFGVGELTLVLYR